MGSQRYVQIINPDEVEDEGSKKFIFDTVFLTNQSTHSPQKMMSPPLNSSTENIQECMDLHN